MKLRDILTPETWNKYGDMDACDDVIDELYPAWCGNILTVEGERHYKEALDLDAEIRNCGTERNPYWMIVVHVDGPDWKKKRMVAKELFVDMCGYCSVEEYEKYFIDDYELPTSTPVDPRKENAGYLILQDEVTGPRSLPTEGIVLGYNEKKKEYVTWAYTDYSTGERSYYWGHYFTDQNAARKDYHERIIKSL